MGDSRFKDMKDFEKSTHPAFRPTFLYDTDLLQAIYIFYTTYLQ